MDAVRAEIARPVRLDPGALERAKRGELGRKHPCWCGSGKRYKHCHFDADQPDVRARPRRPATVRLKMSALLEEVAEPMGFHDCRTIEEARGVITAAATVWNASRLPTTREAYEALEPLVGMLAEEGDPHDAVALVGEMLDVALAWPDDRRIVASATVVEDSPRGWQILAASIDGR